MQPVSKEVFHKYLRPTLPYVYYVTGGFLIFCMAAVIAVGGAEGNLIFVPIFFIGLSIYLMYDGYRMHKRLSDWITAAEQNGELYYVLMDFTLAKPMVDGKIRLGQHYIYGRNSGVVLRYTDISQLYLQINRYMFIEIARTLMYRPNGSKKAFPLAKLKTGKRSQEEVNLVVNFVHQKNPSVKIGYR